MRKIIVFLFLAWIPVQAFSNVNYIDITKITDNNELVNSFAYLRGNKQYYDHQTTDWFCNIPREEFLERLQDFNKSFSALSVKSEELYLLLGDISGYIYNLDTDDTASFHMAVKYYKESQTLSPDDYRVYWFEGQLYTSAGYSSGAMEQFFQAQDLLPALPPADFWNDYAEAMARTNKPSHCMYAMDRVKDITGKAGRFEQQEGLSVYRHIIRVDKDKAYSKDQMWSLVAGRTASFTSRPLGIRILTDSTWMVSVNPYQDHQSSFCINLPALKTKDLKDSGGMIHIYIKTADNKSLHAYVDSIVSKYPDTTKISYLNKYDKMVAYEIKDKTVNPEFGGAHLIIVGIERDAPEYPGLLLEKPVRLPDGSNGEPHSYAACSKMDRFRGRIFYTIILDTGEDVFDEAYSIFKLIYDKNIIIE